MITEEAVPLQVSLEDGDSGKSDYAISWGIHQTLVSIILYSTIRRIILAGGNLANHTGKSYWKNLANKLQSLHIPIGCICKYW